MWNFSLKFGHSINLKKFIYSGCLVLSILPFPAFAKPNAMPISVESDTAEIDGQAGFAKHLGSVLMTQGDRFISGDELTVHRDESGQIDRVTTKGSPAKFKGYLEGNEALYGDAQIILYLPLEQRVVLEGDAVLHKSEDVFRGPSIAYNIENRLVQSSPEDGQVGRTTIILQPR